MGADDGPGWRNRPYAAVVIATVVAGVAAPAVLDHNSFPLSTYPIYANDRGRIAEFDTAVGITLGGEIRRLSLETIADTDDPLIAQSLVSVAVGNGRADELCAEIARRTAAEDVRTIEVVTERHDIVAWTAGDDSMVKRSVHARCDT